MQDLIIRGGTVIDGTGAPRYKADVAVKDGIITHIGDLKELQAAKGLDASGLIGSPGVQAVSGCDHRSQRPVRLQPLPRSARADGKDLCRSGGCHREPLVF